MKFLRYGAATTILTGDAIADALIEYAATLADQGRAEVMDVPAVDPYGAVSIERILLGPAIPINVGPAPEDELEPEDDQFVADLRFRAATLR